MKLSTQSDDLAEIFRLHRAELVRLAAFILSDRGAGEDAVQDVFMRVYRRGDPIDGDPLLYLRVAVVNSCRSMLRRMRLVRRHAEEDSPCPPLTAEEAAMLSEDRRRVLAALASLPRRRREVLVFRFYLELSEAEIAGMLNISPGTVKSTAARSLAALALKLKERHEQPGRHQPRRGSVQGRPRRCRGRHDSARPAGLSPEGKVRRPGRWLLPLAAAMAVVIIALAVVFVSRLVRNAAPAGSPASTTSTVPPKYYMTDSQDVGKYVLQVRRTADGAVTTTMRSPVDSGLIAAATTAHAFFVAGAPNCTTALAVSKVYRITITDSGQISGMTVVGAPIQGMISALAVSPAGSQIAYTLAKTPRCNNHSSPAPATLLPQDVVRVMNLSTGSVQTWQNTATADDPTQVQAVSGLSSAPNGRTLVVEYQWAAQTVALAAGQNLAALGLDTTSGGGSLQTHSHLLWHQDQNCVTCALRVLAGPDDTLIVDETRPVTQQQARQLIVRIPLAGGSPAIVYSALGPAPTRTVATAIYADSSGRWVIAVPLTDLSKLTWPGTLAGWISHGKLHPLPGTNAQTGIAW